MTTILDARGNPIKPDKPALSEDIALAHTTSVRNPRPNSVASTITSRGADHKGRKRLTSSSTRMEPRLTSRVGS